MSLRELALDPGTSGASPDLAAFLEIATRHTDAFYEDGLGLRYPKLVLCDPLLVAGSISSLRATGHLTGNFFCEWGSGFGIAAGVADLMGLEAVGLEIEDELVTRSREMLREAGREVEIHHADLFPEGLEESEGVGGRDLVFQETFSRESPDRPLYEEFDPAEVDLFFVYPWPDQEQLMMDLFAAVASPDAILLMYLGDGEMAAFEKAE